MDLAFTLPDTDGTPTPLHIDGAPAAVVVFTCNHCPYVLAWHERIQAVARDYADRGVRVLQISSNDVSRYPKDSLEAMTARVDAGEFAGPYLYDESQEVARAWHAKTTPDVFVTDAGGIVYREDLDADHNEPSLNAAWLRAALDYVLAGRPVVILLRRSRSVARSSGSRASVLERPPVASGGARGVACRARRGHPGWSCARSWTRSTRLRSTFRGSPTDRVGRGRPAPRATSRLRSRARVYRLADGRFSPTPDPGALRAALERAVRESRRWRTVSAGASRHARAAGSTRPGTGPPVAGPSRAASTCQAPKRTGSTRQWLMCTSIVRA